MAQAEWDIAQVRGHANLYLPGHPLVIHTRGDYRDRTDAWLAHAELDSLFRQEENLVVLVPGNQDLAVPTRAEGKTTDAYP